MDGLRPDGHSVVDPDGLLEFSVVFTDRSLNHMSQKFQQVMRDISDIAREVYGAEAIAIVPGGGTYAMEAVARQFARDANALIVRNGWFSFRWSQIHDAGQFDGAAGVEMARPAGNEPQPAFAPPPIEDVVAEIRASRPGVVFAPHVETSAGMILPDAYIRALADAAHEVGALMVLDCIASGAIWVDMGETGVDVLISAPQKGWSAPPAAGLVMFSARGLERLEATTSDSFALDLKKWRAIMKAYEDGGHAYHATLPTDALLTLRDAMVETREMGFAAPRRRNGTWAARFAPNWPPAASGRSRPRALPRPASWSATRTTPRSRTAASFWRKACRSPLACRCRSARAPTSAPSAWACSASTNCATWTRPWRG